MTQPEQPDERTAFEAWADANLKSNHYSLQRHNDTGAYLWHHVEEAWGQWQAITGVKNDQTLNTTPERIRDWQELERVANAIQDADMMLDENPEKVDGS